MKKTLLLFFLLFTANLIYGQYTQIPDEQFELYLIALNIDSDGVVNGQVLTSDIENITEFFVSWAPSITDITGIEGFTSLEELGFLIVGITEVDLSQNVNLIDLNFDDVALNSLNVDSNLNLQRLYISVNFNNSTFTSAISSLDLSNNILLDLFVSSGTLVEEIDFSNNVNINILELNHPNDALRYVNLKNGNNINCDWVQIPAPNLICVQVDDPEAVIAGVDPPYNNWNIQSGIITDDCPGIGVDEMDLISEISIFPNPVSNILFIDNNSTSDIESIQVYDVMGNLILEQEDDINQLDVSKLASGVLFVKVATENGVLTKKVIKL